MMRNPCAFAGFPLRSLPLISFWHMFTGSWRTQCAGCTKMHLPSNAVNCFLFHESRAMILSVKSVISGGFIHAKILLNDLMFLVFVLFSRVFIPAAVFLRCFMSCVLRGGPAHPAPCFSHCGQHSPWRLPGTRIPGRKKSLLRFFQSRRTGYRLC